MPVEYTFVENSPEPFVECLPGGSRVESDRDALDLVAACGEYGVHRLLIYAGNLGEGFADLKTGLAGAVLLKLSNYFIKTTLVMPIEASRQGRFGEMVLEANRGNRLFHVFAERDAAVAWLSGE